MKIAVTGANGFIGSHICRQLAEANYEVIGLVRSDHRALAGIQMKTVTGSILSDGSLDELMSGVDALIHTAAKISVAGDPDGSVRETNLEGTKKVAEACLRNGVRRMVHFSSIHSMRPPPRGMEFNESQPRALPHSGAYGLSKAEAEEALKDYAGQGLEVLILNPTAVIGPQDHGPSPTGQALIDLYSKKWPVLVQGGYDFVDVRDVAKVAINALTMGRSGQRYIISGAYLDIRRMAALVEEYTSVRQPKVFLPAWLQWMALPFVHLHARTTGSQPMFTAEVIRTTMHGKHISSTKARKELGHAPRSIEETIKDALTNLKLET